MKNRFPGGVWPVMLTPFKKSGEVDYAALEELVEWYIAKGVQGLFAVCQSSEMFALSLEERLGVAECVVGKTAGRVPVIASGHISETLEKQAGELNAMSRTGVDAVILITNRLAKESESDAVWRENCSRLLSRLETDMPLGFYECPYPYKRVLSAENLKWCADTERFYFLKDTCCDIGQIREKLKIVSGTGLKLYNANTTTLLASLREGADGYSGVMANFHPELYVWLCENPGDERAEDVAAFLSMASLIERQCYPVNAKYFLQGEGLSIETAGRIRKDSELTETFRTEVEMLRRLTELESTMLGLKTRSVVS